MSFFSPGWVGKLQNVCPTSAQQVWNPVRTTRRWGEREDEGRRKLERDVACCFENPTGSKGKESVGAPPSSERVRLPGGAECDGSLEGMPV